MEHYLGNRYRQAFYEMVDYVEDIEILLGKSLVSASPRHNIISLTNVWNKAMNAQEQLTNLPLSTAEIHRTARYLAQTGDYAHSIARRNAEGEVMTEEDREQLVALREQASQLNATLHELGEEVMENNVSWQQIVRGTRERAQDIGEGKFRDGISNIEQELNKHPTLIYDGPFSDHVARVEPEGLTGEQISISEAEEIAREAVDVGDPEQLETVDSGSTNGRVEAYNFKIQRDEGDEYSVDISQQGGHLINLIGSREVENREYGLEDAVEKAEKYLAAAGYASMAPTYGEVEDNTAFLAFAYESDEITFYPDLIKVQVALDNNQVTSVDAINYLTFHREREIEDPELDEEEVRNMVEDRLNEIEEVNMAVIPDDSLKEEFVYEVRGRIGEEVYLIYINAQTGVEEEILQLISTQEGTFTI